MSILLFDDQPREWHNAETPEECDALSADLPNFLYPQGATRVKAALDEGLHVLSGESFTERKMLLITDGDEIYVDVRYYRNVLAQQKTELHTVCLGPHNEDLQMISKFYDHLHD